MEVYVHASLPSVPNGGEISDSLHARFTMVKRFVITVRQKAIWALEHFWKTGDEKTAFASTGDRNAIILLSIL